MMSSCHETCSETMMMESESSLIDMEKFENMNNVSKEKMLLKASEEGNFNVLRVLIKLGVSVDVEEYSAILRYYRKRSMTPLMIAANRGDLQCLQFLIYSGADVNAKDLYEVTAVHLVAEHGHFQCLKSLLDAGANCSVASKCEKTNYPYTKGTTPLHLAVINNHVDCVKELIQYCPNYNAVDERGFTALLIATEAGYNECVEVLLENVVGHYILSLPSYSTLDTPLHFAVKQGMVGAVRKLLDLGSDVNHKNYLGYSALHTCVASHDCEPEVSFEVMKLLILNGHNVDVNLVDGFKRRPLHYLIFDASPSFPRRPEMAAFLISYGADINITNHDGLNVMQYEYVSDNSDLTVLKACISAMNVLPSPSDLKKHINNIYRDIPPNMLMPFYNAFAAIQGRLGLEDLQGLMNDRPRWDDDSESSIKKQMWYTDVYSHSDSLLQKCRFVIRSTIGYRNLPQVKNLPLPTPLKSYVVLGADVTAD